MRKGEEERCKEGEKRGDERKRENYPFLRNEGGHGGMG